jgi:hypothetical protein
MDNNFRYLSQAVSGTPSGITYFDANGIVTTDEGFSRSQQSTLIFNTRSSTASNVQFVGSGNTPLSSEASLIANVNESIGVNNFILTGDATQFGFTTNMSVMAVMGTGGNFNGIFQYKDPDFGYITRLISNNIANGATYSINSSYVFDNIGVFIARTNLETNIYQAYNIAGGNIGYKPNNDTQLWFPTSDGSTGSVMITNGAGQMSFTSSFSGTYSTGDNRVVRVVNGLIKSVS